MASLVELGSLPVLALAAFSIPLCSLAGALYILIRRKRIDLPFVGPRWAPLFGDPEAEVAYLKEGYEKVKSPIDSILRYGRLGLTIPPFHSIRTVLFNYTLRMAITSLCHQKWWKNCEISRMTR